MAFIDPVLGLKLVFVLGITNIIFLILVFFSCRCLGGFFMQKYKRYAAFYRYHCFYWWLFMMSVLIHTVLAFIVFGNPF